jgi:cell division protein FtsB
MMIIKKTELIWKKKSLNNSNQFLLFGVILMLAVGIFVSWKMKTENISQSNWQQTQQTQQTQQGSPWVTPGPQQVSPNVWQNTNNQPLEQKVDLLKKQYENIDLAAQKIWKEQSGIVIELHCWLLLITII